jgi:uncharacterized protein CbrC (UPF0167 family)
LPEFRYHPDPLDTGSIEVDGAARCLACGQVRGHIYTGSVYAEGEDRERCLCPWCIADGSAARKFGATFTDTGEIEDIPDLVRQEIETRTPGFIAWQQEQWLACCGDGAAFLGSAGFAELNGRFRDAMPAVRAFVAEQYGSDGDDLEEAVESLSKEDMPTAYIFRCLHCHRYLASVDQT